MINGGFGKAGEMAAAEPHLDVAELAKVTCRSLAIVPGTSHFLTQEKPDLVNTMVVDFLIRDPVPTVAPIRRSPTPGVGPG